MQSTTFLQFFSELVPVETPDIEDSENRDDAANTSHEEPNI